MTLTLLLMSFSNPMKPQPEPITHHTHNLEPRQESIVTISALTARGDLEHLRNALARGLDSGLTVNEITDVLVQMYAYCGFPRSLNAITTFMSVLEAREKTGIQDERGETATPRSDTADKYERGRKTLERLTGRPQSKPAKGFGEFAPTLDRFLKEHLFADIFDSDVLNDQQRELATISALAAMPGVEAQLTAHLSMGVNTGLREEHLQELFDLIETHISKEQAEAARTALAKMTENTKMELAKTKIENKDKGALFPKGGKAPAEYFTGTVYLQVLAPKTEHNKYSIGSVTFEAGARSHWHTHPAGQTLIVIDGKGLYQEKGKGVRTIHKGETIICNPDVEHWHGASSESQMTHIAITNDTGSGGVIWLKPVTEEEYTAGGL